MGPPVGLVTSWEAETGLELSRALRARTPSTGHVGTWPRRVREPGRRSSPPTKAASGLISAGPPSRTVRNKRLLFEPPGACDLFQRPELRLAAREGGAGNK